MLIGPTLTTFVDSMTYGKNLSPLLDLGQFLRFFTFDGRSSAGNDAASRVLSSSRPT